MGVTITHKLGTEKKYVKKNIDELEKLAGFYKLEAERKNISFEIRRENDFSILIDIGNCETLGFCFSTLPEKLANNIKNKQEWASEYDIKDFKALDNSNHKHIENYPDQIMMFCSDFCKTQFCKDLWEHKAVAELIRFMAGRSKYAYVNDEGDYYHTGVLLDAGEAISDNGALINSLSASLSGLGYEVIKGN